MQKRVACWPVSLCVGLAACGPSLGAEGLAADAGADPAAAGAGAAGTADGQAEVWLAPPVGRPSTVACPSGMVAIEAFCIDRLEAPNRASSLPLVMFNLVEAEAWCAARDKRVCFDDEWTRACMGPGGTRYPYGQQHEAGRCNDDRSWRVFDQSRIDAWPEVAAAPTVTSFEELIAAGGPEADHISWLYQADRGGARRGCTGGEGTYDMVGNVEEWTRRRQAGPEGFSGSLRGRYWAESRDCAEAVTTHGDRFRFYELGFRCCADPW